MRKKIWDERTQLAIDEVQAVIKAAFPEAEFQVHRGGNPEGIYIPAYAKADNGFDVLNLIGDRLVDLCVEEGLGIYVVPLLKAEPCFYTHGASSSWRPKRASTSLVSLLHGYRAGLYWREVPAGYLYGRWISNRRLGPSRVI
jgi:hypothetical protein